MIRRGAVQPTPRSRLSGARRTRSSSSRIRQTAPTVMAASATLKAGKYQPSPVELQEVDHVAVQQAVDHVADRAAQDAGQREARTASARRAMRSIQTMNTAAATPMPVKNQRCQPEAAARKENAAPVLCARTMLKKLRDVGGVAQLVVAQDQHLGELVGDQQDQRQAQPGQHAARAARRRAVRCGPSGVLPGFAGAEQVAGAAAADRRVRGVAGRRRRASASSARTWCRRWA